MRLNFSINVTGKKLLLLALILGAALRVPGWFTQEKMEIWHLFETDEEQHLNIIMKRYNEVTSGPDTIVHAYADIENYNVRGYGYTNAHLLNFWNLVSGQVPNFSATLLFSRQMSTIYALLLIVVVYFLGKEVGLSPAWAGVAAVLMAVCDLHASYSHYAIPLAGYLMFVFLSLLGGVRLLRAPRWSSLILLALGAGGAVAFKFNIFPTLWGGLLLLVLCLRKKDAPGPQLPWYFLPVGTVLLLLFYRMFTYGWTWESTVESFNLLRAANSDLVGNNNPLIDNFIYYPIAVMAGIGLPAFALALYGTVRLVKSRLRSGESFWTGKSLIFVYLGCYLVTEAILRWTMDATFVRRANEFMPVVAILAAYAMCRIAAKPWLVSAVVAWSLGIAIVGQSHHWFETRYAFRDWANVEVPKPLKMGTSGYLQPDGLENWRSYDGNYQLDYFAIHESIFSRYIKSPSTNFKVPQCCSEIYHCGKTFNCTAIQDIILGRRDDFELVKAFRTWDVFPERIFYHALYGYYESFLGDVLVFKRIKPQKGEHTLS